MITQTRLRELLDYCPKTGVMWWRVSPRQNVAAGTVAGWRNAKGYWCIEIGRKQYKRHRLVWLYVYGYMPEYVDHDNRTPGDDRLANLRPATRGQNCSNAALRKDSTSGVKGVSWHVRRDKWQARVYSAGRLVFCQYFDALADAAQAVTVARQTHHAAFACHS